MTNNAKVKHLLVVVTRAYADKGSIDDEFVNEWGFLRSWDHAGPTVHGDVALLVIHSCKGAGLAKVIASLELPRPEKAWVLHHSLDEEGRTTFTAALKRRFAQCRAMEWTEYHSEGGTAVSGLLRVLDDAIERGEIPVEARDAVNAAATGRPLFAEKLHGLRSGLLRMRMLFEAAMATPASTLSEKMVVARPVDHQFKTEAQRVREAALDVCGMTSGASNRWMPTLEESCHKRDVKTALDCLSPLAFPPSDNQDKWYAYNDEPTWTYQRLREVPLHDAIRADFAAFARAVDVLIDALETLPSDCLPRKKTGVPPAGRAS